mmetsp:Transcript_22849/g.60697  ORF Transcript_22849/g.60697 Transcript_22849/m.60697 type:complete len:102 (+) Transcript_22849:87-392(+)|eukprot:CAMPEP_0184725930 /NCGR_PEP_ID=MMETSP0314-20130426/32275_1 /TAXON_ID=38298 /ORGANISM="Rhodella maculata, Strain CCMP 736" /LENGTH=101 /DNA_ID=CAMNT_0027191255 /DNA_START=33 /DNA_END=338 /DNA_ORIENTATION=+
MNPNQQSIFRNFQLRALSRHPAPRAPTASRRAPSLPAPEPSPAPASNRSPKLTRGGSEGKRSGIDPRTKEDREFTKAFFDQVFVVPEPTFEDLQDASRLSL